MKKDLILPAITLFLLLTGFRSFDNFDNQMLSSFMLQESELPADYRLVDEQYCKFIQASSFFQQVGIYESFLGKIKEKSFQSFESKKDYGTILYFQFEENFEQTGFLEGLLWGGNKPSKAHPEEYLVKGNVLIIWSTDQKSELKKLSKNKIDNIN